MTKANETNEDINQELSTDELKGVSGGLMNCEVKENSPDNPEGYGYGGTLEDWKRRTQSGEGKFFDIGGDI